MTLPEVSLRTAKHPEVATSKKGRSMTSTCERSLPPEERERPPGVEPDGLDRSASSCAATLGLQQIETLFEELFEFLDRATLEQHVPVGAGGRLDLLGFGSSPPP